MTQGTRFTSGWVLWEDEQGPEKENENDDKVSWAKLCGRRRDLGSHPGSIPPGSNFLQPVWE